MFPRDMSMNTFQQQLMHSYAQHPQFHFEEEAFRLDAHQLVAFNDSYALVLAYGNGLKASQFSACKRDCIEKLAAVFAELTAQTSDPHELRFLRELHAEGERLLTEELDHYHSKPLIRGMSLRDPQVRAEALSLHRDRFYFGSLSDESVQHLLDVGAADLAVLRQAARLGRTTRDALSLNTGPTIREILYILNSEFGRQGVLDSVSAYMGRRMWVTGVALELSVPQATWWANSFEGLSRAPVTLYAHVDESITCPKSIVYLSDVERASGATSCYWGAYEALALNPLQAIIGRVVANVGNSQDSPLHLHYAKRYHQSMSSERFRRHFMRLPQEIRFNSHFGWDVLPDSSAEQALMDRERVMIGRAGTYIVFDGSRLLHRGGMVERGERVALQVVFSHCNLIRRISRRIRRALP
jgi:hypothetical protein